MTTGTQPALEYREVWTGRYEFFHSNPDEVPDLNDWQTEVAYLTEGSR